MATPSAERLIALVQALPKAELHLHIEGTLEPELVFELARRNAIALNFPSVEALRRAYRFENLQSFLDIYYEGAKVLAREQDFFDLAWAYLRRMATENVVHTEIFFDPQTHTARGVAFETVLSGIDRALRRAGDELGISSRLILCFLRDQSAEAAMRTLEQALPHKGSIAAVGLDSAELGHPPEKFTAVFERARREGLRAVAHAGEEGPPDYIRQALDLLRVSRIDHGVQCWREPDLMERLRRERVPLTVCPLSNVRLKVFGSLEEHNLKRLLDAGLCVTVNSDDPAYFGGYLSENLIATAQALDLSETDIYQLVRNGFEASFLEPDERQIRLERLDAAALAFGLDPGRIRTEVRDRAGNDT